MSKKILVILAIIVLIFVVFSITIVTLFNLISKNPIDSISIEFIRKNTDIQQNYGEIIHVGRAIFPKTEKSKNLMRVPYSIETTTGRIIAYITLTEAAGRWGAISLEIIEVIGNDAETLPIS